MRVTSGAPLISNTMRFTPIAAHSRRRAHRGSSNDSSNDTHTDRINPVCAASRVAARISFTRGWSARTLIPSVRADAICASAMELTPTITGGRGTGSGKPTYRSSRSGDHIASMRSSVAMSRRCRSSSAAGTAMSSACNSRANRLVGDAPAPNPSMNRPSDICWTVAAALATMPGCRVPVLTTSDPSPIREVTAARPPSVVKHSGIDGAFITSPARWSATHNVVYPLASAASAARRSVGQSAAPWLTWISITEWS